jgi:hypothetical protein
MIESTMRPVLTAYGRALRSQFTGKMLFLSAIPFLLSLLLWGVALYYGLNPLIDYVEGLFRAYGWYEVSSGTLASVGLGALKAVIVPLVALLALLPLMILTALLFMGVAAMPAIVKHVSERQFPTLEMLRGGSFVGSLMTNVTGFIVFVPLWLLTLPLYLVAPLAVAAQVLLWGWLTARVMAYDALADHASEQERADVLRAHRRNLMLIGMLSGAAGALPGIVWIGGAAAFVLFPLLAPLAVWLYVLVFVFSGLWFQYYCLQALEDHRKTNAVQPA